MRYIVTGGGTGGHIYPALALLDEIKKRDPYAKILYIGRKSGLEEELVKKRGYEYRGVSIKGLPRKLNLNSMSTGINLVKGIWQSYKIIKKFRPDLLIGTGGYVSFPASYVAQKMGVKTFIQEANAYPGKANRILAKGADAVFTEFEKAGEIFTNKKVFMLGNPIDQKFKYIKRSESRALIDLRDDEKLLVSFGGSGGQESINSAILDILEEGNIYYKHLHITGREYFKEFQEAIKARGITIPKNFEYIEYSHEMPILLSAADLVLMSSSAISLSEIKYLKLPSILIPKAYTADNHQEYNASSFVEKGIAKMILEKDLSGSILKKEIDMIFQDGGLDEMRLNYGKIERVDSTELIVDKIFELIEKK